MRKALIGFAVLGLCLAFSCRSAQAQVKLHLVSGSDTSDVSLSGNTVTFSITDFNNWEIEGLQATTYSSSLQPYGIGLQAATITCTSGPCAELYIDFTSTGFTQKVQAGDFVNLYSGQFSGTGASTTQNVWVDLTNAPFGTGYNFGGTATYTAGNFNEYSSGGPSAGPGVYSLTLQDEFGGNTGATFYSTDGSIGATSDPNFYTTPDLKCDPTPEPTSLLLMGTGLLSIAGVIRRRLHTA